MSASSHSPSKHAPVVWKDRPERDLDHQLKEWTSGSRGGGSVPRDFTWGTNPKQAQEENGVGDAEKPIST